MDQTPAAIAYIESWKLIGLPANYGYTLCLQVFQGQVQVQDRFCPGADDKYRCATQFRQVGGDVHACFSASMHSSDTPGGEEANPHHTRAQYCSRHCSCARPACCQCYCQVAPAHLQDMLCRAQALNLVPGKADNDLPVMYTYSSRHSTFLPYDCFHRLRNLDIGRVGQAMRNDG